MQEEEIFKIAVNGSQHFEVDGDSLDFQPAGARKWHILLNGKSHIAELIGADYAGKSFDFRINGSNYTVKLADRFDQLVEKLGLSKQGTTKIKEIKAPMPGLVLELHISEGQEVTRGQSLLILEAMKMENIIKSPGEGTIKRILIDKGKPVDKNQLLIEFD